MPEHAQSTPHFDNSYLSLPDILFKSQPPAKGHQPKLIAINDGLAEVLGLSADWLRSDEGLAALSGSQLPKGAAGVALGYAGHQFGNWAPQLGDGRAMLLGEVVGTDGRRRDIHLKGSGRTVYSRGGDGKAPLGPVLREYIMCEAMHALGVPTSRALGAVLTGETVYRETPLPGAVFARVASSHIRVGTFQYLYARDETNALRALADHAVARHIPEAAEANNPSLLLLENVIEKQASLVAHWMSLGFIHGVMNTDNMTISGETIDYGPCAFMEAYNPAQVFSSIDYFGRYAYSNQPQIAQWNLAQLAQSLLPILSDDQDDALKLAQAALDEFPDMFENAYAKRMGAKIGIEHATADDLPMVQELLKLMHTQDVDFTLSFRRLSDALDKDKETSFLGLFGKSDPIEQWLQKWRVRVHEQSLSEDEIRAAMDVANPVYIPRNHRVEEAIHAAHEGNLSAFTNLNAVLVDPFTKRDDAAGFEQPAARGEQVHQTFCGT
ncbi:MAG: YdiU family protein [Pseudomonadota bacterium]